LSYRPRSSLPAHVLAWLAARLAHLLPPRPPGTGGTPPLSLEVRLDAVAAVILDGLSYRRAGRAVGISKTEVGDSMDLLLGPLGALGFCQPDGTFITTLDQLRGVLVEMAASGEVVVVDGLATRVQRPRGWANQKVLYDAKRHSHTAQGLVVATIWGDLLWLDGGWPGSCHEHELMKLAGLERSWTMSRWQACWIAGSAAWPRAASTGMRRSGTAAPSTASATRSTGTTACRQGCARWSSSRSPTWQAPGHCAAGAGCCTASGPPTGPPAHLSASAAGGTESPHDNSITDTLQ
jgi:hypothetical protein